MGSRPGSDDEGRIAELLRVNAELAAEVRSLNLDRRASPRSGQLPVARQLAKLTSERDAAAAKLQAVSAELQATSAELQAVKGERDALLRRNDELERETTRLRSGVLGLLRRTRARLFRS